MSSRKAAPGKWKELLRVLRKSIATQFYKTNISWNTKVKSCASLLPFYFKGIKLQSFCTFKSNKKKIPLALHSSLSDSKWPFCNLYKRVSSCLWPFTITIFLPLKQTPVPKPKLNGSLSLLKGLLNLNRPVLCRSVGTCGNTADMFSTEKYMALCPCLYPHESSRKYLYVLFIYTIILSLYQAAEKCMHIDGLIFPNTTTRTTDISSSNLSFCVQSGSIWGEKLLPGTGGTGSNAWSIDLQEST